jgi:hypothetical protein
VAAEAERRLGGLSHETSPLREHSPIQRPNDPRAGDRHGADENSAPPGPWSDWAHEGAYGAACGGGGGPGVGEEDKKMGRRAVGAFGGAPGSQNQGNSILGRRSTRVHAPPGGASSFSLGGM